MIHQVPIAGISQIRPLFQRLTQSQPMCAAVLAGVYPGKVYVDEVCLEHLAQPRTALLTTFIESETHGTWCFLAGEPANDAFNRSLNSAIYSRQIISAEVPILLFSCDPDDWGGQMDAIVDPRPPVWILRYRFVSRGVGFDWRAALPPGYTVEPMDDSLRRLPGLELPGDVSATISKWQAMAAPRFMDFGFVVLDQAGPEPMVASWATVDFVAAGAGDLGFFTQPEYRRRGLGTVAAGAALVHGFALGLQRVNWTCDAGNPGSTRTAEKLGLERVEEYHLAVLIMDEAQHMALFRQQGG